MQGYFFNQPIDLNIRKWFAKQHSIQDSLS